MLRLPSVVVLFFFIWAPAVDSFPFPFLFLSFSLSLSSTALRLILFLSLRFLFRSLARIERPAVVRSVLLRCPCPPRSEAQKKYLYLFVFSFFIFSESVWAFGPEGLSAYPFFHKLHSHLFLFFCRRRNPDPGRDSGTYGDTSAPVSLDRCEIRA